MATPRNRPRSAPATLERDSEKPLYQQLAERVAQQISAGHFTPGMRLPAEPEMMAAFGVSRVTVRQAIALLARNGQVVARRGKGTYVTRPMLQHDLGVLRGFHDALTEQGLDPQTELLEFSASAGRSDPERPPGLDLPVRLRRRYLLEGRPFAIVEAWLPAAAARLGEASAARLTVYEIVGQFLGEKVAVADLAIRCEPVAPRIVRELGLAKGSAVLVMERRSATHAGRVLECMRIHIVPERYEFRLRLPGPLEIASSLRRSIRVGSGTQQPAR